MIAGDVLSPVIRHETGAAVLGAHGVGVRVDGRWLVRDVDLTLFAGEVLAVLGPNGAGKSTLLSLLAGDLPPTEGSVSLGGMDWQWARTLDLAHRRAVLPQTNRLS